MNDLPDLSKIPNYGSRAVLHMMAALVKQYTDWKFAHGQTDLDPVVLCSEAFLLGDTARERSPEWMDAVRRSIIGINVKGAVQAQDMYDDIVVPVMDNYPVVKGRLTKR